MNFYYRVLRHLVVLLVSFVSWASPTAVLFSSTVVFADTRLYVDGENGLANPTGQNPGESWSNAYKYLQDAFARIDELPPLSQSNQVQIWVRNWTYRPDEDANNPTGDDDTGRSFQLRNFVQLYGGFKGTETELSERRVRSYPTILSGDLSGNDVALPPGPFTNYSDNSVHVVYASNTNLTARLDGFTIRGANADVYGGGVWLNGAAAIIANCTFFANQAYDGGAIYAGMFLGSPNNPQILNCTFVGNYAESSAGAVFNSAMDMRIVNCVFSGNTAGSATFDPCE